MSLFGSSKSAITLKRQSLEITVQGQSQFFEFTPESISNLEVKDRAKFSESLTKFITDKNLKKNRAVLILTPEVVFEKRFPESIDLRAQIDKFYSELPFDPLKLVKREYQIGTETIALATNRELVESVAFEFNKLGWKVEVATTDEKLSNHVNFLNNSVPKTQLPIKIIIIFGIILAIGCALAIGGYFLKSTPNEPKVSPVTKAPTAKPTSAPTAVLANKKDFTVQILNGSGTPGDAGKVKDILAALGFNQIETGNTEKQDSVDTTLALSQKATTAFKQEIEAELNKIFSKVVVFEASVGSSFDISVTTGTSKE